MFVPSPARNSLGPAQNGPQARPISAQLPPHQYLRKKPSRQSLPDASTALASFTCGRVFPSEQKLLGSINWNAVTSKPLFDDPPIFQTLRIFLFPPRSSPFLTPPLRKAINTDAHISHLQRCWDILKKGEKTELQKEFGMPEKVGEMRFEIYRIWIMVKLAWRIVQALKNAVDHSRISEVGEYALYVVEMNKKVAPKKFDPLPLLTLACSLTYPHPSVSLVSNSRDNSTPLSRADRDEMALEYFGEGFKGPNTRIRDLPSNVYAKAHYSRLLRRLGRDKDAEDVEEEIKQWWATAGSTRMRWERVPSLVCAVGETPESNSIIKKLEDVPRAPLQGPAVRESGTLLDRKAANARRYSPNQHLSPHSAQNGMRQSLVLPDKDSQRGRVPVEREMMIPRASSPALDNFIPRSTSPNPRAPSPMGIQGMRSSSPNPRAPSPMGVRGMRSPSPNPRGPSMMGISAHRSPSPNPRAPSPMRNRPSGPPSPRLLAPAPIESRPHRSPSPVGIRDTSTISKSTTIQSSPTVHRQGEQPSMLNRPRGGVTNSIVLPTEPRSPLDKPLPKAPSYSSSRTPVIPLPLGLGNGSDLSQLDGMSASSSSPTESRSTNRSTPNTSPSSSTCADDHPPAQSNVSESKWTRRFWKRNQQEV